jgi:hypothetical protein
MENNPYESPKSGKLTDPKPTSGNLMSGQELFGVAVRTIGFYFVLMGLASALKVLLLIGGLAQWPGAFDSSTYVRAAIEWGLPGIIGFFFPKLVVRIAYRDEIEPPAKDS